jgi:hypothetical protein
MKFNPWTVTLLGAGLVSLPAITQAEEKPNFVQTALASTTLSGYVDTSVQWNFGTGNDNLPPYAFGGPSKADGFNLNVVELRLDKPVDAADVWGAGYHVDLIAGPDANALSTQSSGLGTGADFGVKQAYLALHAPVGNGLDFKLGVWDTIIGYEVFESANDPNFTRSYGYSFEPTTHTGLLATYQVCELLSVNLGIANTFGSTINGRAFQPTPPNSQAESFKTYMASFTVTAPTNSGFLAGSTLSGCIINGFNQGLFDKTTFLNTGNAQFGANETHYYVGGTINTPVSGLKFGTAFDYIDVHNAHGDMYSLGVYAAFQATEKLSFYGRAEYARQRGDFILLGLNGPGATELTTMPEKAMELTATVQYDLWKNVLSRLELRWDHSLSGQKVWGPIRENETGVTGGLRNEFELIANLVYKF